eukprot:TRINITY_DN19187_c0_g1_i1.p1 TRINITY_DN19187_c0_g1~~TRINITY_DN19187_c0_g1_i1.p1  ORF type:complete len:586 (+),score=110.03 TRINITY_DN19187_c0_g1_i1:214-1971(+)
MRAVTPRAEQTRRATTPRIGARLGTPSQGAAAGRKSASSGNSRAEFGVSSELPALSVCRLEAREELLRKLRQHLDDPALAEFTCPICWEPFWQPVRTVCGHAFCEACLLKSVLAQLGQHVPDVTCPLCRHPLNVEDVAADQALMTRIGAALAERTREGDNPVVAKRSMHNIGAGGRVWRGLASSVGAAMGNGRASPAAVRPGTAAVPTAVPPGLLGSGASAAGAAPRPQTAALDGSTVVPAGLGPAVFPSSAGGAIAELSVNAAAAAPLLPSRTTSAGNSATWRAARGGGSAEGEALEESVGCGAWARVPPAAGSSASRPCTSGVLSGRPAAAPPPPLGTAALAGGRAGVAPARRSVSSRPQTSGGVVSQETGAPKPAPPRMQDRAQTRAWLHSQIAQAGSSSAGQRPRTNERGSRRPSLFKVAAGSSVLDSGSGGQAESPAGHSVLGARQATALAPAAALEEMQQQSPVMARQSVLPDVLILDGEGDRMLHRAAWESPRSRPAVEPTPPPRQEAAAPVLPPADLAPPDLPAAELSPKQPAMTQMRQGTPAAVVAGSVASPRKSLGRRLAPSWPGKRLFARDHVR